MLEVSIGDAYTFSDVLLRIVSKGGVSDGTNNMFE